MTCRVLQFAGPLRARPGRYMGTAINVAAPQHGLWAPDGPRALRPKPFDVRAAEGYVFVTSHTCLEGGDNCGKLSVWEEHSGRLVSVHTLPGLQDPNMHEVWYDDTV